MTDVVIVGGGILGVTLAWELARGGAAVTVVDRGDLATQASAGSLAWLNVSSTADMGYALMRKASMDIWNAVKRDFEDAPITLNGAVLWGEEAGGVASQMVRMAALDWPCAVWEQAEIARQIPGLQAPKEALFAANEGFVHPVHIVDWTRGKAMQSGAVFVTGEVEAVAQGGVVLADGNRIDANAVVVMAGNATADVFAPLGPNVPMNKRPGIVMQFAPCRSVLPYVMATPELDLWQDDKGMILASSALSKTAADADKLAVARAEEVVQSLFPELPGVKVQKTIKRNRPIPADGFPVVGRSGVDGVWLAVTHSGMTLAPVIAQALADDILGRPARHDLARFSLERDWTVAHERAAL